MNPTFRTDGSLTADHMHSSDCRCALHSRRLFTGALLGTALAGPALAQPGGEGVRGDVGNESVFTRLVSAEQVEQAAAQEYRKLLQQAAQQRALGPPNHPQVIRLRAIADRIVPYTPGWNARAKVWQWEVNLLGSPQLNVLSAPGCGSASS